jgi:hypothetical protein
MKQKKENKLRFGKETIQNLDIVLDKDDQKGIKGGTANLNQVNTQVPIFC